MKTTIAWAIHLFGESVGAAAWAADEQVVGENVPEEGQMSRGGGNRGGSMVITSIEVGMGDAGGLPGG